MHPHLIAVATVVAKTVPGESEAYFWAGVIALAGALVSVFTCWAAYKQQPYKWNLGFLSLVLASAGTSLGLWKLAGESGWDFLLLAVVIAVVTAGAAIMWSIKRPVDALQDRQVRRSQNCDAESDRSGPRPK